MEIVSARCLGMLELSQQLVRMSDIPDALSEGRELVHDGGFMW